MTERETMILRRALHDGSPVFYWSGPDYRGFLVNRIYETKSRKQETEVHIEIDFQDFGLVKDFELVEFYIGRPVRLWWFWRFFR